MIISVVICTYNREAYLPTCLDHLKNQTVTPDNYEIVIVDNNSIDRTAEICSNFIKGNPGLNVKYVKETQAGLSFARNRGIDEASGEIICFVDDDGYVKPDYITTIRDYTTDERYKEYIAFGGKVIPWYNEGKDPKWISKYIIGVVSGVDLGEQVKSFDKKYPAGCNMIFRREFFEKYSRFNTDLHTRGDDKYVFDQLYKAKLKVLYIPALEVLHFIDDYRLEKKFIIRLSKIIGQSEKIRLKSSGFLTKFLKFAEYLFKLGAACILALGFVFRLEFQKAYYLILIRYYVLIGYFISKHIP